MSALGCDGAVTGSDKVTLRFWNGFTGPDGRTMLALVKRFNRENPDVHVVMQRMEWGTYYNKLFVSHLLIIVIGVIVLLVLSGAERRRAAEGAGDTVGLAAG